MNKRKKIGLAVLVVFGGVLTGAIAYNLKDSDVLDQFLRGNTTYSDHDYLIAEELPPYEIDEFNSTTNFIRYASGSGSVYIKRITVHGTITRFEKTTDTWANRTNATYQAIND